MKKEELIKLLIDTVIEKEEELEQVKENFKNFIEEVEVLRLYINDKTYFENKLADIIYYAKKNIKGDK